MVMAQVLSGQMLFGGLDYASVTHRVAFGGGPYLVLTPQERSALGEEAPSPGPHAAGNLGGTASACSQPQPSSRVHGTRGSSRIPGTPAGGSPSRNAAAPAAGPQLGLGNFVEWVLQRDPNKRPTLAKVRERLQQMREHCLRLCSQQGSEADGQHRQ